MKKKGWLKEKRFVWRRRFPPPPPVFLVTNCHDVCSAWRAGPQPRAYGQCGVSDLNRDAVRPVLRAGHQPRSCEARVACRTSTAIMWGQCGVPDLNRDHVRQVLRAGPQPRSCEFSVARRTSTAKCVRKKNVKRSVRRYVRKNVRKNV